MAEPATAITPSQPQGRPGTFDEVWREFLDMEAEFRARMIAAEERLEEFEALQRRH